jgi:putative transposase
MARLLRPVSSVCSALAASAIPHTPMTIPTQPAGLLHWLALWQAVLVCLRRFWQSCCSWLASKPLTPPTRFKPWLSPVSRRAMPCGSGHWRSKPDWVRLAVFDLALGLPGAGYRTIAHCFNLQLALQSQQTAQGKTEIATVSKTFVAKLLTSQRAALAQARQRARSRSQARREPIQTTWGIDLTGLPLTDGSSVPVFGVIDHGSRAIVALEPVATYNSLILLGKLLIAMGTHGKPKAVRSDNDAVFKTWLFRAVLRFIGVHQQFTDLGSPWQNGRIERFWRTLKSELQTKAVRSRFNGHDIQTRMKFASVDAMRSLLDAFRFSYNAHRPHQSLGGATPAMVWNGQVDAVRLKLKAKPIAVAPSRTRKARAPPA